MKRVGDKTIKQTYGRNLRWGYRSITNTEVPFVSLKSRINKAAATAKTKYTFPHQVLQEYVNELWNIPDARYYNASGLVAAFAVIHMYQINTTNWENIRNDKNFFGTEKLRRFTALLQEDSKQDMRTDSEKSDNIVRQCALIYRYVCFFMNNRLRNLGMVMFEEIPPEELYEEEPYEPDYFEQYIQEDFDQAENED